MAPPILNPEEQKRPYRKCASRRVPESGTSSGNSSDDDSNPNQLTDFEEICLNRRYTTLLDKIKCHTESKQPFFSLEFFPPRTQNGVANLLKRMERMEQGGPLFVDVTWHPGGNPASDRVTSSSHIAGACLDYCFHETMLHLTCAQYTKEQTLEHLERIKKMGIRNILALRGDLPDDPEKRSRLPGELNYATDLVRLIRENYGDYFTIGVAAYPTGHPEAPSYWADMVHLKEKVEAGADFIITQLFFTAKEYLDFVAGCKQLDIQVPIIPGIMPIQSYDSLRHIVSLSKLKVPKEITDAIEPIRHNEEAIRNYGIAQATDLCRQILQLGEVPGLHFYTLNKEIATREILQNLGMWGQMGMKILPWKAHVSHSRRCNEEIRPIFWSSKPKSYIYRTRHWEEFPRGTWNINSSEHYGELKDYYLFYLKDKVPEVDMLNMWGKVTRTPWNSDDSIFAETELIIKDLEWCNRNGILTVNSQPNVNGADSNDPVLGWGRPGGYVYRRAYLEFFIHKDRLPRLLEQLDQRPTVTYHIVDETLDVDITNNAKNCPITVTWGVHPASEVQQTTIVDPISFRVWKDEAYGAWREWAKLYPEASTSRDVIQWIRQNYCLANLVDSDYPKETCLFDILRECVRLEAEDRARI